MHHQGHTRSQVLAPIDTLLVNNTNLCLPLFLSYRCILVKLLIVTGECLYLTLWFGANPWTLDCEIWPQDVRNVTLLLWYTEPFRCGSPVWQMDRQPTELQ